MNTAQSPSVLIIDDDPQIHILGRKALQQDGFSVIEANNGQEGITLFERHKPDIILLDVLMPGIDGYETCAKIRKLPEAKTTPILIMTSLNDLDSIGKAFDAQATDFFIKPINWIIIRHRIRYILRGADAINKLNLAMQDLRNSKEQLSQAQHLAKLGYWEMNLEDNTITCSKEVLNILQLNENEKVITEDNYFQLIHPEDKTRVVNSLIKAIQDKILWHAEHRVSLNYNQIKIVVLEGDFSKLSEKNKKIEGILQDITERKKIEQEMQKLSHFDKITGLANRKLFEKRAQSFIDSAKSQKQSLALVSLDVTNLKRINEIFGINIGDVVLKKVSEILINSNNKADKNKLACFGSGDFVILMDDIKTPLDVIDKLQLFLSCFDSPLPIQNKEIFANIKIGISIYPSDGKDLETLITHANAARHYINKSNVRYNFYSEDVNVTTKEEFDLEIELRKALQSRSLLAYYQPKLDLKTRKINTGELLLRWEHASMGFISPDKFIPIAEESGLIIPLGQWVFLTACEQIKLWTIAGYSDIRIAINLSPAQFWQNDLVSSIKNTIMKTGVPPEHLELEVTETALTENIDNTIETLHQLKLIGIKISIDDFGTGYSSLSLLKKLPIDTLKIDQSLIQDITSSKESEAINKAIIEMAHSLKLKVIAEGVETKAQLEKLRSLGCDGIQGFYISPAVEPQVFLSFLRKQRHE